MRRILFALFIPISMLSHATNYYVSSGGDDLSNGTSELTPWKTIAKVNSVFSLLQPGDKILFKCGNMFYGTLKIIKSGAAGNPIVIGAYGTGAKPVIRGTTNISSWANEGNGIYSTSITCESSPEMVVINGTQYAMGRWPNSSWATVDSHNGDISITDADLNASITNWTGAEVVQRKECNFIIDRFKITSHTSNTITYSGDGKYPPGNGFGYFIQNDIKTLDSFGEWYYNPLTLKFYMYFGVNSPGNYTVSVSTIDDLVNFTANMAYITFDNIMFTGANKDAIYCDHNNYITIQNCDIDFSGNYAIRGYVSANLTVANTNINHSNDQGIFTTAYCKYAKITGVIIRNTGLIPGAGECLNPSGSGMTISQSDNSVIEYCEVYNSGYNGISFSGSGSVVRNNFVNTVCLFKEDGGGIFYTGGSVYKNMSITDNIVLNAFGIKGGNGGKPTTEVPQAAGIYLDYYTTGGVEIRNNTVAHCNWNAIFLHGIQNVKVINNSVYDALFCIKFQEQSGLGCPSRNITMNDNIFFAKTVSQLPILLNSTTNDFSQFGAFDNNYYARPLDNLKPILPTISWRGTYKSLAEWQTLSGLDLNSHISPIALTDTAKIDFYFNASKTNKVITLSQPMIDVRGTKYSGSITLFPFTSAVLMVDPNPAQPVIPVYTSSVIQNTTPSVLEMTYNMNLANIKPAVSAFRVMVNSAPRTVNSVTISGAKVLLTLASPVINGNVITVAYTKPAINPLQTSSGGQAASISAQPVTNNVNLNDDRPVYLSSTIENATPNVLEMTYSLTLAGITPPASAFTVMVNSVPRTVNSVAISGTEVLLTLASPVTNGNIVTVAYTIPETNQLRSASGWWALSISAQPVTNNVNVNNDRPVYLSSAIENDTPDVLEMTYSLNLDDIIPPASAFSVMVNSAPRTVNSVAIYGGKVLLTLASPVTSGNVVTVAYTIPASNQLRSVSGWWALSISAQPVTNNVNINNDRPVYLSSVIENAAPYVLKMTYSLTLAGIIPPTSAFTVMVNSVRRTVNSVAISGTKVILTLASPVVNGNVVTVAYTIPETNQLRSSSGWWALSIGAQPVTNNVAPLFAAKSSPSETTDELPQYVSSAIENSNPDKLEITYNTDLADVVPKPSAFIVLINGLNRTVKSVAISGNMISLTIERGVVYGEIVTVAYSEPIINPIQTPAGIKAETFPYQSVTNNCLKISANSINNSVNISIYPNPARDIINVSILEPSQEHQIIRIFDSSGKLCMESPLDPGTYKMEVPITSLKSGMYIVKIVMGSLAVFTQKLIVF